MSGEDRTGWVIVFALATALCILAGLTLCTFGMYLNPVVHDFGASHEQVARGPSLFLLTMMLSFPAVSWLFDRGAVRVVMLTGVIITALGYEIAARSRSVDVYVAGIALSGAGFGIAGSAPSVVVIKNWISKGRNLAYGVLFCGLSAGSIIFPVVVVKSIETWTWRTTMAWSAGVMLIVVLPIFWLAARLRPEHRASDGIEATDNTGLSVREGIQTAGFWQLTLMQILASLGATCMYFYTVPYLVDTGHSATFSATVYSSLSIASLCGYIGFGVLADRWGARKALLLALVVTALGIESLLITGRNGIGLTAGIVAFIALMGSCWNVSQQLFPALVTDVVGSRNFATLFGICSLFSGVAAAAAVTLTGVLFDTTRSYTLAFGSASLFTLLATVPLLLIKESSKVERCGPISH
jgi:predicted MFS family arabinose efflux permease